MRYESQHYVRFSGIRLRLIPAYALERQQRHSNAEHCRLDWHKPTQQKRDD